MNCGKKLNLAEKVVFRGIDDEIESIIIQCRELIAERKNKFMVPSHQFCGHIALNHEDSKFDLINESEKENKKLRCHHIRGSGSAFYYQAGCPACEGYLKQWSELKKEKSMKHPCGKVFDVNKKFKCNDGDEVSSFEITNNYIIVKFKSNVHAVYLKCGHHADSFCNNDYLYLINVPEEKGVDLSMFGLRKENDGIIITANGFFILKVTKDGYLRLYNSILKNLGLQLDEQGRIKLEE
jgi:hypothetical protein